MCIMCAYAKTKRPPITESSPSTVVLAGDPVRATDQSLQHNTAPGQQLAGGGAVLFFFNCFLRRRGR